MALCLAAPSGVLAPGWAHAQSVPDAQRARAQALVATAQKMLGIPYVWGGQGHGGFDCSGFVGYVYGQNGYVLPRVSRQQAMVGLAVSAAALLPGDLLFFTEHPGTSRITHVAMSLGGARFIHAALGRGEVAYDALTEHYYAARLAGARRPLALPPGRYSTALGLAPANLTADSQPQLRALAQSYREAPPPPVHTDAAQVPADMLEEHADAGLPAQLVRISGRANTLAGTSDAFGPADLAPDGSGVGINVGIARTPTATPGYGLLQASYLGPATGLRVAARLPVLLPLWGTLPAGGVAHVRWRSARDWARLIYGASLGAPGAKIYFSLDRAGIVSMGQGLVMRHHVPNAASATVDDLLAVPNALTGVAELNLTSWQVRATVDDVLSPAVLAAGVQWYPGRAQPGHQRLAFSGAWAADLRAPITLGAAPPSLGMPPAPKGTAQVQGFEVGVGYLAYDGQSHQLRPYVAAALLAHTRVHAQARAGVAAGATWALFRGQFVGSAHTVSVRAEARLSQGGFSPSYFGFGYSAARRLGFSRPDGHVALGGPTKLDVLASQMRQPPTLGGVGEVQYALAKRLQLGLHYEDGGLLGRPRAGVPYPSSRSLTAFVGLLNLPLGPKAMQLHLHGLWHAEQARVPWPGHGASADHAYTQLSARCDLTTWLDVGATLVHPLGLEPPHTHAWVGLGGVNVHLHL